jgi:hypothetical protein
MRFGKLSLAAVAVASLVSMPTLAQAASANAVGASKVQRVGATTKRENKQDGGSGIIIAIVAAVAVIGGIVIAAGNNNDSPTSP